MKIQKNITLAAAIAAVCLAAYSASAAANYIGFKFVSNDEIGFGETTAPGGVYTTWQTNEDALAPTEKAGVPPLYTQAHWNNLGMYGTNTLLADSNGTPTSVNICWYALGTWHAGNNAAGSSGGNGNFPTIETNNNKLMDGFIECTWQHDTANVPLPDGTPIFSIPQTDQPIIFLTGLNHFLLQQGGGTYSIIIYVNTDGTGQGRTGQYYIDMASGTTNGEGITDLGTAIARDISVIPNVLTPTLHYYVSDTTQWAATDQSAASNFTLVPVTSTNSANSAFGNYVEFDGLTNDTILIRTQNGSSPGATICGVQIASLGVAIPPNPTTPSPYPTNTVYGNSSVTLTETATGTPPISYRWQTDGGSGSSSLTNIPGANTNTLALFMPDTGSPYTVQYDVILTNIYSSQVAPYQAATSAVCYITVLPASAPILTTDVGGVAAGSVAVPFNTNAFAFIGGNVQLHAEFNLGSMPITNQWVLKLDSGGGYTPIAGATNWYWTVTNVQSSKAGNYELTATNSAGNASSTQEHLTALADPAAPGSTGVTNMYVNCVMTNHPWAYWKFEETNDTFFQSMQAYDYSTHNFDATYDNSDDGSTATGCKDGGEALPNLGPGGSDKYAGFPLNNMCAKPSPNHDNGYLYAPPLNLTTNTVTFTMWIKPNVATLPKSTGLFMNRNGYDAAGIGFGTTTNGSSTPCLAYTWNNNSAATYGWNSGLFPVAGVWNFVACTITPSNTVMYLYYVNGNTTNLYKAVNNVANVPEAFTGGTTWIASDNWNNGNTFNGWIDELAIFTNSLGEDRIQTMFLLSLGLTNGLPPVITQQPTNVAVFQGQTVQFSTLASGIPTPPTNGAGGSYQWQFYNGSTWNNLGSAVAPPRLTTNATMYWQVYTNPSTILSYRAIAKNASGSATSGVAYVTFAPIPTWNLGVWTVNFCVPSSGNLGLDTPYAGLGVLGTTNTMGTAIAGTTNTKAYWNVLSGGNMQNSTSLRDDGVTYSGVNVGATNGNLSSYSDGTNVNNLLLDQYCQIFDTNNGVNFFFTQVPKGIYNLALFGCTASYADRGIGFTAITNGVSAGTQWVTNNTWGAGDLFFTPYDNTVVFTNLVVTSGMLQVNAAIARAVPKYTNSTEADFNGAQLQLVTAGPDIWSLTNSGTNLILTYAGGILLSSTNIVGPTWVTNFGNPYTIIPTGQMRFFKVYTNKFPNP